MVVPFPKGDRINRAGPCRLLHRFGVFSVRDLLPGKRPAGVFGKRIRTETRRPSMTKFSQTGAKHPVLRRNFSPGRRFPRKIFYSYNFKNVLTGNRLHFIILIS
ncbi:MAG: hypothetical protein C6P37_13605 [Caldibacillus debilis]|uniref:Uncharacterized protein n=1 Tax=Caldibacillus debilis TaxID=301148 RepID=A0A3E0K0M0_9BACI|nr:MAG: hypothetical protein C6W57_09115 [Caldibacillus debilis]REJ26362.1 MAG: hypothetical protein C6P37_13605 [Caldibacillus debilis]